MKYPLLLLSFLAAGALFAGRPIARWDVIPYQRVSSVFKAGVVAFHEKAVTVEFTVNGRPAHTATKPELNGRTKVWEFVFPFDASKLPDGPVQLGAKVTAEGEAPYTLPGSMPATATSSPTARTSIRSSRSSRRSRSAATAERSTCCPATTRPG